MAATKTPAKNTELVACSCGDVTFVSFGEDEMLPTCKATTKRTFAPGHDARLKGILIRHALVGDLVRLVSGEVVSVEFFAARFGFGDMVADGIRKGMAKAQAKADKKVAKAAPVPAPTSEPITAKVGRWEYAGTLFTGAATADGVPVFRYTDKKGAQVDTHKFTQI